MEIEAGTYLTGSLFLEGGVHLHLDQGAKLLGSTDVKDYPEIDTRIAGVEMEWPAAILNVIEGDQVIIDGPGCIDGQGPFWWNLYWGDDQKGGQRKEYDAKDLRWIVDYEVKRPRELLLYKSNNLSDQRFDLQTIWFLELSNYLLQSS